MTYTSYGYDLVELCRLPVADRLKFVLETVGGAAQAMAP